MKSFQIFFHKFLSQISFINFSLKFTFPGNLLKSEAHNCQRKFGLWISEAFEIKGYRIFLAFRNDSKPSHCEVHLRNLPNRLGKSADSLWNEREQITPSRWPSVVRVRLKLSHWMAWWSGGRRACKFTTNTCSSWNSQNSMSLTHKFDKISSKGNPVWRPSTILDDHVLVADDYAHMLICSGDTVRTWSY